MITGTVPEMRRQTSKPSIPGSPMSSTTSLTAWRRSSARASSPERTHRTSYPLLRRYVRTSAPMLASSSTTMTKSAISTSYVRLGGRPIGLYTQLTLG